MPIFTNNNIHQNIVIHESNKLQSRQVRDLFVTPWQSGCDIFYANFIQWAHEVERGHLQERVSEMGTVYKPHRPQNVHLIQCDEVPDGG